MISWDWYIVVQLRRDMIQNAAFWESQSNVNVGLPVHTDLVGRVCKASIM